MSRSDALVIGAGVAGFAAAAYLARAGKNVLLLEAEAAPREPLGALDALDPQMISDLGLIRRGLRFVQRDLPLTVLRAGEAPLTWGRDSHAAARAIATVSEADARALAPFRQELFTLARRLRRFWWSGLKDGTPHWVLESRVEKEAFDRLCLMGADAYLAAHFESEVLVSALLFDAVAGGLAPSEPGSALTLVWRAAGEMAGLQAASALPERGTLLASLAAAAGAARLRPYARVARILTHQGAVQGVALEDGETLEASLVLSTLSRDATEALLGRPSHRRAGEARLLLTLSAPLTLAPALYRIAERPEIYIAAHEAARAGRLAAELPLEFVLMDSHRLAVTLRPVPLQPPAGMGLADWRAQLAAQAMMAISRRVPGLASLVAHIEFQFSGHRPGLERLLAPAGARILTGTAGLYLCGADAEPVASISGRAARIAAGFALLNS